MTNDGTLGKILEYCVLTSSEHMSSARRTTICRNGSPETR
ncbi:hypothetical protein PA08_2207 [Cutibacterium modestum P08]|uniref:Uncharacterized protein n=1 Tax=Cutibacterium modestum HL044PA1 TaxID=765109 RepID=A0ABP2K9C7_9ACTN|nr:hypothetical protein HMPREF9621_01572 [Cutibacterium modestum HL037PA2]EFS92615.1 hypothetical protein HMPREF9607_01145 [Cutibacterium modestum HL044PA1]EGG26241.1 hypothetical protein PA08_2207 [Cutibacterium modestum P08]